MKTLMKTLLTPPRAPAPDVAITPADRQAAGVHLDALVAGLSAGPARELALAGIAAVFATQRHAKHAGNGQTSGSVRRLAHH